MAAPGWRRCGRGGSLAAVAMATMAMRWRGGDATETMMDGNGRCDDNATATTALEGVTATRQRWNVKCDDGRRDGDGDEDGDGDGDGDDDGDGDGNGDGDGDGVETHPPLSKSSP